MAFSLKTWVNRISEYPNRRKLTHEDGSTELVTVARAEGQISAEGNAFSAEEMNDLENRIKGGFDEINQSLVEKANKINVIFIFSNKKNDKGFYYTNSVYIPNNYTFKVVSASFIGSDGNFKDYIKLNKNKNYIYFYSNNDNFAGLTLSIEAYTIPY